MGLHVCAGGGDNDMESDVVATHDPAIRNYAAKPSERMRQPI